MGNEKQRWPYLSPVRPGWDWIGGMRGEMRALLLRENADRIAGKRAANDAAGAVLDVLEDMNGMLGTIQCDLVALVTEAYYRDVSWQEIARRLDRTKQTVHQRYQRRVHARATHDALRADLDTARRRARAAPPAPDQLDCQDGGGDSRAPSSTGASNATLRERV